MKSDLKMVGARTQRIPAWSRQITANGPACMAQALASQAAALGISTGEMLRQLWIIGAKVRFPKLAKALVASHRKYYPSRAIFALNRSTRAAALLTLFCAGLLLAGGHHDPRGGRVLRISHAKGIGIRPQGGLDLVTEI